MCYLGKFSVDRWVCVRLECVGSLIILFTAVLAVTSVVTHNADVGLVGIVLSYALSTTGSLVSYDRRIVFCYLVLTCQELARAFGE